MFMSMSLRKILITTLLMLITASIMLTPFLAEAQSEADDQVHIWMNWDLPADFEAMLAPLFASEGYEKVLNKENADLLVDFQGSGGAITSHWVYVPVVAFPNFAESVQYIDIQRFWNGDNAALSGITPDNTAPTLLLTNSVLTAAKLFMGEPSPDANIQLVPDDALLTQLWQDREHTWSLFAFNDLNPSVKALAVDGTSIFDEVINLEHYPFSVQIGITGEDTAIGRAIADLLSAGTWKGTNRDVSQISRIVLSGVTALTRATAYAMENQGITLPAEGILPFVEDADLFHTSNEVPFSVQCPYPDPYAGTIFCADDRYMELLTYIGLDVVELTGNHVNDYGPGALKHSLEMYDEVGMHYFGGGYTPDEAKAPLILEVNGTSIAFIGCNVPGPFKAWVSDDRPGAAPCDDAYLEVTLGELSAELDIVIMTVQDYEYYRYDPPNAQITRFTNYANWGADIVIGSQAHQPQGFTFAPRADDTPAFLHHGLGNLFFDQMAQIETRQMFMDKLIIYDGKVLAVELYTGIIENYCCPRPMTDTERYDFLQAIYAASGW